MVKLTPGVVLGGVATTVAVGTIGYVAWFDCECALYHTYMERNFMERGKKLSLGLREGQEKNECK